MTDQDTLTDAVTGEELTAFDFQMADGRVGTVNARDEDSARAIAREQGGGVGVLSVGAAGSIVKPNEDDDAADDGDSYVTDDNDAEPVVFDRDPDSPSDPLADRESTTLGRDDEAPQADGAYGTDASPDGIPSGAQPTGTHGEPINPGVTERDR